MEMTKRQAQILESIVQEYTETARPVSSKTLNYKYGFDLSPATIRSEMAVLEREGYITHPHTSAGRIPTDKGYRFYVNSLQDELDLVKETREQKALKKRVKAYDTEEEMAHAAADALSDITKSLAVTFLDRQVYSHGFSQIFHQPEFARQPSAVEVARLIDSMDILMNEILGNGERTRVFIGREAPFGKSANVALVFSKFKSEHTDGNFIGIIGPTRMQYEKTIPLVEYVSELLEDVDDEER